MNKRFWLYLFAAVLLTFTIISGDLIEAASPPGQLEEKALPIYRLSTPQVNEATVQQIATAIGVAGKVERQDKRFRLRSGDILVEANTSSGGIWAADQKQLWNPDIKPSLPDEKRAREIANEFFKKNQLLPSGSDQQFYSVDFTNTGATYAAFFDRNKKQRSNQKLDIQVNYGVQIKIPTQNKIPLKLPVVGGGGEFNLTLGNQGKIIGYSGLWRSIEAVETLSPVIPQQKADEQFQQQVRGLKLRSFKSSLAYYSASASVEQKFLYPVYVYRAVAVVDNETVPLRLITIPATEFGPRLEIPKQLPVRSQKNTPQRPSTLPEGTEEGKSTSKSVKPDQSKIIAQSYTSWREAGTSWIGLSGGLSGSQNNAKGFVDELSADGWNINFNWGDGNAWESDWRRNDDSWVDAADFVFYTGHANLNGWVLSYPDDTFLSSSEVGASPDSPGDIWGQQDLEWAIIAACGPLQDDLLSPGGGDVLNRWDGAFDGLHQLLGYGAITFDNQEEGKSVVRYARDGDTLINAWFRAAREIQPGTNGDSAPNGPTIWVGAMYVYRSGTTSPANDHIWLHGSVAPDPTSPNVYVAIWTTT